MIAFRYWLLPTDRRPRVSPPWPPQALAYFLYNFVVTLILEPVQQQCFNAALDKLRTDPRITVRLGSSITGERRRGVLVEWWLW